MTINNHSIPTLNSDVRWRRVYDEAVVVIQESSEIIVVNTLGARILEIIEEQHPVAAIIDILLPEQNVTREQLQVDVFSYMDELAEAGVVTFSA